jgi:uncharacterized membrane protein
VRYRYTTMMVLKRLSPYILGLLFVGAGVNHFIDPDFYLAMMPPYLPAHAELILLSGILEVLAGVGVFMARWRQKAGMLMILVMIGVFPANVHMAMNPAVFPEIPVWFLYLRLPLQGVLIWWAWAATRLEDGAQPLPDGL